MKTHNLTIADLHDPMIGKIPRKPYCNRAIPHMISPNAIVIGMERY